MNEKRMKKMRTSRPTTARRLSKNSRAARRQPLWTDWTSPPSGLPGGGSGAMSTPTP
jgi:hypothetical protein